MAGSPYSYALEGVTPIDPNAFGAGLNVGTNLIEGNRAGVEFQQKQDDRAAALAAQQAAIAQQQALRADLTALAANPTTEGFVAATAKHPELSEHFKRGFDMLAPAEKATRFEQLNNADLMLTTGHPEQAADYLDNEANAYAEKRPKEAESMRSFAKLIRENQGQARTTLGLQLAAIDPKYVENRKGLLTEDADVAAADAEARKKTADAEVSEVAALHADEKAMLDLDYKQAEVDKLFAETKDLTNRYGLEWAKLRQQTLAAKEALKAKYGVIPPKMQMTLDESATSAAALQLSSAQSTSLANKFRAQKDMLWNKGLDATIGEGLNSLTGRSGVLTAARKEFIGNREKIVSAALKGLGAATEAEREAFRAGVPSEKSDPVVVADWLDKAAILADRGAKLDGFKAEWIAANKGLGDAQESFDFGGAQVLPGTSFNSAYTGYASTLPIEPEASE